MRKLLWRLFYGTYAWAVEQKPALAKGIKEDGLIVRIAIMIAGFTTIQIFFLYCIAELALLRWGWKIPSPSFPSILALAGLLLFAIYKLGRGQKGLKEIIRCHAESGEEIPYIKYYPFFYLGITLAMVALFFGVAFIFNPVGH